jgi:hypothetical protein
MMANAYNPSYSKSIDKIVIWGLSIQEKKKKTLVKSYLKNN